MGRIVWKPRDYQELALRKGAALKRLNLHMSPGMGKTATVLTLLTGWALMGNPFPVLVAAPKRVANSVWEREVAKWPHLSHLRVSKILGTPRDRITAVERQADIYCINYENLMWLDELLPVWPFRTIIADESTRIKRQRCSFRKSKSGTRFLRVDGSKNARALIKHAVRTPYYVNLTGTPAPNGLKDLWGQQFPIDGGRSLGASYSAFKARWFRAAWGSTPEQDRIEPLPDADEEIMARIAPTTVSVNAYDWFDVSKPREVDIRVDLPPKAMKQYRQLHAEAVLRLTETEVVTAVNAGALTQKCLQVASGHLYGNKDSHGKPGEVHQIHTAKLEALESLVENLNGEPLLVAYHFTADREAILRRFKGAELLPSDDRQAEVEARWNAGKIPMLVVHPASAGHGLDLQLGGCNLCFYTVGWDLELYEQVIERIGPVRQAQAGLDRLVTVYRLIAHSTWDQVVVDRIASKASVQSAIRDHLRAQ